MMVIVHWTDDEGVLNIGYRWWRAATQKWEGGSGGKYPEFDGDPRDWQTIKLDTPSTEEITAATKAMEAKRLELIAQPIARIYRDLAEAALEAAMAVRKGNEE